MQGNAFGRGRCVIVVVTTLLVLSVLHTYKQSLMPVPAVSNLAAATGTGAKTASAVSTFAHDPVVPTTSAPNSTAVSTPALEGSRRRRRQMPRLAGSYAGAKTAAFFVHIPKCAGASFVAETTKRKLGLNFIWLSRGMGRQGRTNYDERCFLSALAEGPQVKMWLTMLRSPRQHVLSQYTECRFDWAFPWTKRAKSGFPRNGSLEEDFGHWVRHFEHQDQSNYFRCYHPWNMATRQFSCHGYRAHTDFEPEKDQLHMEPKLVRQSRRWADRTKGLPDLAEAMGNLQRMAFVGIVEFYSESMCLLRYKVGEQVGTSCTCGAAPSAHHHRRSQHVTHRTRAYKAPNITEDVWHLVDNMTQLDQQLYRTGVERFLEEVFAMEKEIGQRILCDERVEMFLNTTTYIEGMRERVAAIRQI